MKLRTLKLSRRQRINFYRAFLMLNKQEFGGHMGFDGYHHCYSMTPAPATDNAFDLYLENNESPRGTVIAHVIVDNVERLGVTYSGLLPDGSRVRGAFDELVAMELQRLPGATDKAAIGMLLLKGSTECDPALLAGWEPTMEETIRQTRELGRQWGKEDAMGEELAFSLAVGVLQDRHERLLRDYVYDPGEDGSSRTMTDDEQMLLSLLFIKTVTGEDETLKRFTLGSGVIFRDEDTGCPCGRCYAVDLESKEQVIGIEVMGPLNNPDAVSFFCSNEHNSGLAYFPTATAAVALPLSILPKKQPS